MTVMQHFGMPGLRSTGTAVQWEENMNRPGAAPLGEQILILIIGPPFGATVVWLLSRGWAATVQGGAVSEATKKRQKLLFWFLLIYLYVMAIVVFGYAWLTGK